MRFGNTQIFHYKYYMIKITDFPKLESPFVRTKEDNNCIILNEINEGYNWVFEGGPNEVLCVEKLDGTCCGIVIENGVVTAMFNRTNRIPFIGGTLSKALTEGVNNAMAKERFVMQDGLWWGELIGPKIQGNDYKLTEHEWIPFEWAKGHISYNSWHKYPKTYDGICKWFMDDIKDGGIFSLYMRKKGIEQKPEGVVFHNLKTGQMAKLRIDMLKQFTGRRHSHEAKEGEEANHHKGRM